MRRSDQIKIMRAGFIFVRPNYRELTVEKMDFLRLRWEKFRGPYKQKEEVDREMQKLLREKFIVTL